MAQIVTSLASGVAYWAHVFWTHSDPRSAHLPFLGSPVPVLLIIAAYLYFVLSLGPRLMRDRKPYNLEKPMLVYNVVQVVWCAYTIKESVRLGWSGRYNWFCEPLLPTQLDPIDFETAYVVWQFFMLKIVDLMDTVFMVLKKNYRQISFLHLYHHAGMVFAMWLAANTLPGGGGTLMGPVNCFVHCVLYGYYAVSILYPGAKGAWWKKYITILQLVQFAILFVHSTFPFFVPGCQEDLRYRVLILTQNAFMFVLFSDFYYKNYVRQKAVPATHKKSD